MYRPIALLLLAAAAGPAPAGVFALGNAAGERVTAKVTVPGKEPVEIELYPGESRPVSAAKPAKVEYTSNGKVVAVAAEPYSALLFTSTKDGLQLHEVEFPGKPPAAAGPGGGDSTPITISVKLLVDETERRTRRLWEPTLKKRLERAAEVMALHVPVKFEFADADEYTAGPATGNLAAALADFQKKVPVAPAKLAVAYTSRTFTDLGEGEKPAFGLTGPPGSTHILIREGDPRSESERVEVLVSMLGRIFGAVPSPDPISVMRPKLGDGKAQAVRFRIGFDPLNTLAMNICVEELRAGAKELRPAAAQRLGRVYAAMNAASDEELLPEHAKLLATRAVEPAPVPVPEVVPTPAAPPMPPVKVAPVLTHKEAATRRVVEAISAAAKANTAGAKLRGDALTAELVRTAAGAAAKEPDYAAAAFALGLGIALDDSDILRKNPLSGALVTAVETADERKARVAVLGNPTVHGRRDLCQHFAVSAALTEIVGGTLAEQVGLAKEQADMLKPSGFSFSDLCADIAGIELARLIKAKPALLAGLKESFTVADFVPGIDGLRDGLNAERFRKDYGDVSDARFEAAMKDIRTRVADLKAYAGK